MPYLLLAKRLRFVPSESRFIRSCPVPISACLVWAVLRHYAAATAAKLLQLCLTLCDPRDGSPPGFPVPGILQARTLDWVAISFSNA